LLGMDLEEHHFESMSSLFSFTANTQWVRGMPASFSDPKT
jgi:hypothetical protein